MNKAMSLASVVFLAAVVSCDSGSDTTSGAASTDCPIGMFKPEGLTDCVFPAESTFGQPTAVTDNRCATGQPAFPPSCVSDTGRRAYLSASHACALNYHFEPGVCQRGGGGETGSFGGFVGTAGTTQFGGFTGAAGSTETGGLPGAAGSTNTGGSFGGSGTTGTGGDTGGTIDTGGATGAGGLPAAGDGGSTGAI